MIEPEEEGEGEPMPDDVLNGPGALDELFSHPVSGNGLLGDVAIESKPTSPSPE